MNQYKNLGDLLKRKRISAEVYLESIEEDFKICIEYLQAIELGDPTIFPSWNDYVFFASSYAQALGVNAEIVQKYLENNNKFERIKKTKAKRSYALKYNYIIPMIAGIFLLFVIVNVVISLLPPSISLSSPVKVETGYVGDITTKEKEIQFVGNVSSNAYLELNKIPIRVSADGSFNSITLPLELGNNIFILKAISPSNTESSVTINIIREPVLEVLVE